MFVDEVMSVLTTATVGVENTNIFSGTGKPWPVEEEGPYMRLISSGGSPTNRTHSETDLPAYVAAALQLLLRTKDYTAGDTMIRAGLTALMKKRNVLVQGVWWLSVTPLQVEPIDLGVDEDGWQHLSLNLVVTRRPNAAMSS